jgi:hypothetical protein
MAQRPMAAAIKFLEKKKRGLRLKWVERTTPARIARKTLARKMKPKGGEKMAVASQ